MPFRPRRAGLLSATPCLALAFMACASPIDSAVFLPEPVAPRPADHPVRIYAGTLPSCPYQEVGIVVWEPTSSWHDLEDGVAAMRERARTMGGDAIAGFRFGEEASGFNTSTTARADSAGNVTTVATGSVSRSRFASGTVIRYTGPGCEGTAKPE